MINSRSFASRNFCPLCHITCENDIVELLHADSLFRLFQGGLDIMDSIRQPEVCSRLDRLPEAFAAKSYGFRDAPSSHVVPALLRAAK